MTPELKEKLLLRLFSSIDYMEKFTECYTAGLQAAEDAFSIFEKKCQTDSKLSGRYAMEFRQWKERVIPNFQGMKSDAVEALKNAKSGHLSTIRSTTGNLRGLSKDMDGIGWDWWNEIEESYRPPYSQNISKAQIMGDNIYKTLSQFWRPGSILKESITGPIDEQQLLVFLLPGEPV
jgi:hypothetical protein